MARRSHRAYRWRGVSSVAGRLVKILFFVGSVGFGVWGVHWVWVNHPGIQVTDVRLKGTSFNGDVEVPWVKKGASLFGFSAGQVKKNLLERYPQMASASVRRRWDRTVEVTWTLRDPVAKVFRGGKWWGVDGEGRGFPLGLENKPLMILSFTPKTASATDGLRFLKALEETKAAWIKDVFKIKILAEGETVLYLKNGAPIFWGACEDFKERARQLDIALKSSEAAGGVEYIKFVNDHRVVVKTIGAKECGERLHGKSRIKEKA